MTKEEILAMEAGKELDTLVAEKVMGHPMPAFIPEEALGLYLAGSPIHYDSWTCVCHYDEGDVPKWLPDPYSTDISAAWQVVDKICNWDVDDNMLVLKGQAPDPTEPVGGENEGWWEARINGIRGNVAAEGKIAPEAICKVALLAKAIGK